MNKMIILNSPPNGVNKRKVAVAIGVVVLFLLAVKLLGTIYYSESAQPIKESSTYEQSAVPDKEKVKEDIMQEDAFYSGYRMEREKVRGKQIDVLNEVINSQENNQQAQLAAANRLVQITEDMETELKAEQLLKSKGYRDCVVIMQGESATAVIQSNPLVTEEKLELKSMLGRLTNCKAEAVSIIVNRGE